MSGIKVNLYTNIKQKQGVEQKEIKGGSQKKFEFWENVVAATIGDYLVNPIFLN